MQGNDEALYVFSVLAAPVAQTCSLPVSVEIVAGRANFPERGFFFLAPRRRSGERTGERGGHLLSPALSSIAWRRGSVALRLSRAAHYTPPGSALLADNATRFVRSARAVAAVANRYSSSTSPSARRNGRVVFEEENPHRAIMPAHKPAAQCERWFPVRLPSRNPACLRGGR